MRGFMISEYAHPKDISLTLNAPEPRPEPGEVLIDVYSAGLNFFDVNISTHGAQVPPPAIDILPSDFTGTGQISKPTTIPVYLRNGVGWQDCGYFTNT